MSTQPVDVTVVIPTHHREKLVVEAAESALAQTGVAVEVIVVDDSKEGSARSAIEGIGDPRACYVQRAVPSGGRPALVRNDGLSRARGRFVHFLDDDDLLADGALAALSGALRGSPLAGVAIGAVHPFSRSGDGTSLAWERAYFERGAAVLRSCRTRFDVVAALLFDDAPLVGSACMVRTDVARAVGGFDPEIEHCGDGEMVLRAVRASGFVFVDRTVVHYRTGAPSLIHDPNLGRREMAEVYRVIQEKYRAAHSSPELYALKLLARARRGLVRPSSAPASPLSSAPG